MNLGVTPEKAKSISQEESRKLKDHLETVVKELNAKMGNMDSKLEYLDDKNKKIEKSLTDLESKKPAEPTVTKEEKSKNQRVLLTSLNSQSNIELDENLQNQLKTMSDEIKEHQSVSIENEEQIQQINKRLSTLEGGSAGVLGFLERVDEVSSTLTLWHPPVVNFQLISIIRWRRIFAKSSRIESARLRKSQIRWLKNIVKWTSRLMSCDLS